MRRDGSETVLSFIKVSQQLTRPGSRLGTAHFFPRACGDSAAPWLTDGRHHPGHSCMQWFGGRPRVASAQSPHPGSSLHPAGPLTPAPRLFHLYDGHVASCPVSRRGQVQGRAE